MLPVTKNLKQQTKIISLLTATILIVSNYRYNIDKFYKLTWAYYFFKNERKTYYIV